MAKTILVGVEGGGWISIISQLAPMALPVEEKYSKIIEVEEKEMERVKIRKHLKLDIKSI